MRRERAIVEPLSLVRPRPVEWFWKGLIPLRTLTVFDGDPGLGKSTLTLDLAARISRGDRMPDGSLGPGASGVVLLSAEDDVECVIRPRLDAAGADVDRVVTIQMESTAEGTASRDPEITAADLEAIEQAITDIGFGVRLVIVDPLMAYLPTAVNAHRYQDVRRALRMLRGLAERTGAGVIAVRHFNKGAGGLKAIYRGGGSIGIAGAARAGLILVEDPDHPDDAAARVMASSKMNLAPTPPARRLRVVGVPGTEYSKIEWAGVAHGHTADSLLSQPQDPEERRGVELALAFLRELLAGGRIVPAKDGTEEARARCIADRTLDRARTKLHVQVTRPVNPGPWYWSLPLPDGGVASCSPFNTHNTHPHTDMRQDAKQDAKSTTPGRQDATTPGGGESGGVPR